MDQLKKFSLIVAFTKFGRGMGYKNRLPWQNPKYGLKKGIPEDFRYFMRITSQVDKPFDQNAVIMGRKTFESMENKPLKNRVNFVLTSNPTYVKIPNSSQDVVVCNSLESVLHHPFYKTCNKAFIIGGSSLYKEAMEHKLCDKIYTTEVDKEFDFDTVFPEIPDNFELVDSNHIVNQDGINLYFKTYQNTYNINSEENQYLKLVNDIITKGENMVGRNGVVRSLFGVSHTFDLQKGFPLLTTKRMFFSGIVKELLFFLKGDTDAKNLDKEGVKIWNGNTTREFLDSRGLTHYVEGDLGPMYGWNWRHFGYEYKGCNEDYNNKGYDQLRYLIKELKENPSSRRLLLTTYDPSKVEESVLAPCHGLAIQFYVREGKYLDCLMFQRSVDVALGYPFNIASYALLVNILSLVTGYLPGRLTMSLGNVHLYDQHIEKVKTQLERTPYRFPRLVIDEDPQVINTIMKSDTDQTISYIENLTPEKFKIDGYMYHPGIKMDMVA